MGPLCYIECMKKQYTVLKDLSLKLSEGEPMIDLEAKNDAWIKLDDSHPKLEGWLSDGFLEETLPEDLRAES